MTDSDAVLDVLRARFRQSSEHADDPSRSDGLTSQGELVVLALHYAVHEGLRPALDAGGLALPPAHRRTFAPGERRADLVRAAALLIAEIERLDRAGDAPPTVPVL